MKMRKSILMMTGCVLCLTGCDGKEKAEARLARGCEAAVKVMLNKPDFTRQIDNVKSKSFGMSDGYKLVTLNTVTKVKDTGEEANETFNCKFQETQSLNYIIWSAELVQLKIDDVTYGSEGGEIYGSVEDQMALTNAVEAAMK